MRAALAFVFGLCAFGAAQAADLNNPVWDRAPGQDDWAKAYPAHAAQAGVSGAVKMKCAATAAGLLANCAVVQETPTGEGFGAAALSLATGMALKPTDASGQPVAGRDLIVPVRFEAAMLRSPSSIIVNPDWLRRPTDDQMAQFFPANMRHSAHATVQCVVSTRGLLDRCAVTEETPPGSGVGSAALAMSSIFVMRPMTVDGLPVGGGKVTIPIGFLGDTSGESIRVARVAPWASAPTLERLTAAYPKGAIGRIASGHAVLRCQVRSDGSLQYCETVGETPEDHGFADAAESLIKDFRVDLRGQKAAPDFRVDVPFDFRDPSRPAPPTEVYAPVWLQSVNPAAVARIFPQAATAAGLRSGKADIECTVQHDGSLKNCVVTAEDPAGLGFGAAALTVAGVMVMNPWTAQGDPVDGARIHLPVRLELPADTPAAPVPAAPAPAKP